VLRAAGQRQRALEAYESILETLRRELDAQPLDTPKRSPTRCGAARVGARRSMRGLLRRAATTCPHRPRASSGVTGSSSIWLGRVQCFIALDRSDEGPAKRALQFVSVPLDEQG
jgi:hypothetical protein